MTEVRIYSRSSRYKYDAENVTASLEYLPRANVLCSNGATGIYNPRAHVGRKDCLSKKTHIEDLIVAA
jgi:hypothetical protein